MKHEIIIIGTGLAGLSAGFELTEKNRKVLMIEARNVIGGRTSSWIEDGMQVESGLHRFLGFYSALPDLLKRSGIDLDRMLFWEDEIEIIMPDNGPRRVLGVAPIFNPLKTLKGVVDYKVNRIPADFYSLSPGNEKLRPLQKTHVAGLFLAGDYTKQPYLATMEGAVVSGKLAVEALLDT